MVKFILRVFLFILPYTQILAQLSKNDEISSNKVEFSTTNFSSVLSGATTKFSPITTFHGATYFVYCNNNRRPIIGKINASEVVEISYLDKNKADIYTVQNDDHHVFSIGVDRMGYLHVIGDAHANFFEKDSNLLPERFKGASYLHWVSKTPEDINSFQFIGLDTKQIIPGYAFSYFSFHNDMNGVLYAQYRSRVHHVNLPPGSNGWCMAKYNETSKTWQVLGEVPESTNANAIYPALIWEDSGYFDKYNRDNSFYQGFTGDVNFDFNNRMHIATTINADNTIDQETHVVYAYSDDSGESFKKPNNTLISKLPIRPTEGIQQGSIVDSIENKTFDGIYSSASVVFDMNGVPAVSFLPLADKTKITSTDFDHFRYWDTQKLRWSDLYLSPQKSQVASEHSLDCNGIISFAGAKAWNGEMHRTTAFDKEGYVAFTLPNESKTISMSGVDERAIREENVYRRMITNGESLMILSSKFEPKNTTQLTNDWQHNKLGNVSDDNVGIYNNVLQIKSSGKGLLADGTLDLQFISKVLKNNGGIEVRIINIDYHKDAFSGLMLSENIAGSDNFYAITIDYEGLKAWSNTGNGGKIHFKSTAMNEPAEWLKIVRTNTSIQSFHSDNGKQWTLFDSLEMDLSTSIQAGLIAGSGDNFSSIVTRADNLKLFEFEATDLSLDDVKQLKTYPNPANSTIHIPYSLHKNQIRKLLILDSIGNQMNFSLKNNSLNALEIDISTLKKGIYFIVLPNGAWGKFIKN